MDEQQIRQIIWEVLRRVSEGESLTSNMDSSSLPKAYFIFPKGWQNCQDSQYMPMLKAAEGKYQRVIVLPERDANEERFPMWEHAQSPFTATCMLPRRDP